MRFIVLLQPANFTRRRHQPICRSTVYRTRTLRTEEPHSSAGVVTAWYLPLISGLECLNNNNKSAKYTELESRYLFQAIGGLDSQVDSVVGQSAKVTGSIPGGAKVLCTDGICKYLPVSVSSYVEVCLCLLCSVCIN